MKELWISHRNGPFIVSVGCVLNLDSIGDKDGTPISPHENPLITLNENDSIEIVPDTTTPDSVKLKTKDGNIWVSVEELGKIVVADSQE